MTGCRRFKIWKCQVISLAKANRRRDRFGVKGWRCDKDEKATSLWRKCMGAASGWHGYPNQMPGLRTSGHVAEKAGGKKFSWLFGKKVKFVLQILENYARLFNCDTLIFPCSLC